MVIVEYLKTVVVRLSQWIAQWTHILIIADNEVFKCFVNHNVVTRLVKF